MPQLLLCRVCLASNVTVYNILNSCLQEMYEKLTRLPLHADDGKPSTVCYICLALLRKSYQLWVQSVTSDRLLSRLLATNRELTQTLIEHIDRKGHKLERGLTVSVVLTDNFNVASASVKAEVLKEEPADVASDTDHVSVKGAPSDSEDDLPLTAISSQKKTKEPVRNKDKEFLKGFKSGYARELILTREQQLAELRARGSSVSYLNAPFKCAPCRRGYVEPSAFANHRLKHHAKSGSHVCEICTMRYKTARKLRAHVVTAHERRYQCNTCEHRSHTASQAREHEKWHRGHLYVCKLCGHTSRASTSHLTHLRAHHRTQHVCAACGDSFVGAHGLRMHQGKAHKYSQPVTDDSLASERYCGDCDIQFASMVAWKRHILSAANHAFTNHKGVCVICGPSCPGDGTHLKESVKALRPTNKVPPLRATTLTCEQCGSSFANGSKLQAHVRRVHLGVKYNKNVVCEVCGKSCTSNASLKYHQRTHTGEKPYQCVTCPKRFADSNQLRIHTRRHTGERPYCCRHCGRTFTQKPALNRHYREDALKYHQRTHTGEKPYQCQTCPKRFADSNQLRIHTRRHTGERPYCCRHCGRTFTQKPALNRHYRVHTGAKPYSCQHCAKSFSQSNSLKLHVRTVHLKMPGKKRQEDKKEVLTVEKVLE